MVLEGFTKKMTPFTSAILRTEKLKVEVSLSSLMAHIIKANSKTTRLNVRRDSMYRKNSAIKEVFKTMSSMGKVSKLASIIPSKENIPMEPRHQEW